MLKRYNKPEIALLALAGFLFLAKYSYDTSRETSYTKEQVSGFNALVLDASHNHYLSDENARKVIQLYGKQ